MLPLSWGESRVIHPELSAVRGSHWFGWTRSVGSHCWPHQGGASGGTAAIRVAEGLWLFPDLRCPSISTCALSVPSTSISCHGDTWLCVSIAAVGWEWECTGRIWEPILGIFATTAFCGIIACISVVGNFYGWTSCLHGGMLGVPLRVGRGRLG